MAMNIKRRRYDREVQPAKLLYHQLKWPVLWGERNETKKSSGSFSNLKCGVPEILNVNAMETDKAIGDGPSGVYDAARFFPEVKGSRTESTFIAPVKCTQGQI
jgi:hypothetical protein